MKQILFATTNPAKIIYYTEELQKQGLEVLTLKDLNIQLEVEENGKTAEENAAIKAKAYYEASGITTISVDDNLFIEGFCVQPGNNIRRIQGKRLDDEEMLSYYTAKIKQLGGKVNGYWIHGIAVCNQGKISTYSQKSYRIFTKEVSKQKIEGYPLDSISIVPEYQKYRSELTKEEIEEQQQTQNRKLFEFMIQQI